MLAPVRVGDVIAGKYRVERVLGRGGMGVVVAAMHLGLRERVAVKFLLPRPGAERSMLARFVREGRAAMRIRSEHVVRVHDIGTLESGEPFLVMEYLEGRDLAAVLDRDGPLPVDAAIEYVLQAIEALAEAHARGIVHRDLKPANLFLGKRADGSALVKVLDFGIAKSAALEASGSESMGAAGTPVYMAPEQMRSGAPVDARTDIWALGVTLHTLLTGEAPFRAGSLVEIHERILAGAPLLRAGRPDAPEALEAVVLRCMQKEPSERYASVAELAEALAPLGPAEARVYAQRAARIAAAGPIASPDEAAPDAQEGGGKPDSGGAGTAERTDASASASWRDANASGVTTGAPQGVSRPVEVAAPRAGRVQRWRLPLALAGAAAAGGLVAVAAIGDCRPSPAEAGSRAAPSSTPTATPASIAPAASAAQALPGRPPAPPAQARPIDAPTPASKPPERAPAKVRWPLPSRDASAPSASLPPDPLGSPD